MTKSITFVGWDVHKNSIAVALADASRNTEVRNYGIISKTSRQSLLQHGILSNRWLLVGIVIELAFTAAIIGVPFLQPWFGTASHSLSEFFLAWPFLSD